MKYSLDPGGASEISRAETRWKPGVLVSNADSKKIESNIKQLRDVGGAYSACNLVYPLTAADLEALTGVNEKALGKFRDLGM